MTAFWLLLSLGFVGMMAFNGWLLFRAYRESVNFRSKLLEESKALAQVWQGLREETSLTHERVQGTLDEGLEIAREVRLRVRSLEQLRRDAEALLKGGVVSRGDIRRVGEGDYIGERTLVAQIEKWLWSLMPQTEEPLQSGRYGGQEIERPTISVGASYYKGDGRLTANIR